MTEADMSKQIFMTDITDVELDQSCAMRYWFSRHEAGTGIIRRDDVVNDMIDSQIHNDFRMLSYMEDISPPVIQAVVDEALDRLSETDRADVAKMELLYRRLGWFAAFAMFMEPRIREDYETLDIDPCLCLDRDPLFVMAYPDRLLQNKHDNHIVYREYVPNGPALKQESWLQSWHYKIRLHVGIAAARDYNHKPASGQVMGLSRGFRSVMDNRLIHPYVYGWHNKTTSEWSPNQPDKLKGNWEIAPVWKYPAGVVSWVRMCGERQAEWQFQTSPSVFLNRDILDAWIAQRIHREREIKEIKSVAMTNFHLRHVYFPRVTSQCVSPTGDPCPFKEACWDKKVSLTPLKSNLYIPNVPYKTGGLSQ